MLYAKGIIAVSELPLVPVFQGTLAIHSCLVDQNVLKILIVQEPKFAQIKSVSTHALDYVVSTLFVPFQIMYPNAIAYKGTLATLQCHVTKSSNLSLKRWILAEIVLVVNTVANEKETDNVFAHVYLDTLVTRPTADLNVWSVQNVAKI